MGTLFSLLLKWKKGTYIYVFQFLLVDQNMAMFWWKIAIWSMYHPKSNKQKKGTLVSPIFKVDEKKVSLLFKFLSSANEVSTGPTCQKKCVCLFVCLSVVPVFFSRRLIGWYTGFWQLFWHPTYLTRCFELGWAVPRSDFLAWLSSATLKIFISGVSSQILMR